MTVQYAAELCKPVVPSLDMNTLCWKKNILLILSTDAWHIMLCSEEEGSSGQQLIPGFLNKHFQGKPMDTILNAIKNPNYDTWLN